MVTGTNAPQTIHDFYGFPGQLYAIRYPAPGNPVLAAVIAEGLTAAGVDCTVDTERGLDHGAWSPISLMYPDADIPVLQLSVQPQMSAHYHYRVGQLLADCLPVDVLVLGSGGAAHNLQGFRGQSVDAAPLDYAQAFDVWLQTAVLGGDDAVLFDYLRAAPLAEQNHPTPEHLLPIFVAKGAAGRDAVAEQLHNGFTYGMLSMAAYGWRQQQLM
jgi:4,5-DOPA dioxygenase extradiol